MNILVIFTGGTIGSTVTDKYISTDKEQSPRLLELYSQYEKLTASKNQDHFSCLPVLNILSENMDGSHLHIIIQALQQNLQEYDGIIITHGTDTLQYTGAGLSLAFPNIEIPVVLVSSNYILEDTRANGFANFAAAVSFIRHRLGTGIFVSYQNNISLSYNPATGKNEEIINHLSPVCIYRGDNLLPHTVYSDALYNMYGACFCKLLPEQIDSHIVYERYALPEIPPKPLDRPPIENFSITSGVLMLPIVPGMCYPALGSDIKALLLIAFHSGTLPTQNDFFKQFIRHAHALDIPVYVLGAYPQTEADSPLYETAACYEELHLKLLPPMSPVDAYMQLWGTPKNLL